MVPTHYDNFFKPIDNMKRFEYKIGVCIRIFGWKRRCPKDYSGLKRFLKTFEKRYSADSDVRMMRMLYYYSLAGS